MRRLLAIAGALLIGTAAAEAARIDDGPLPDIGRYLTGCWLNAEGTFSRTAGEVSVCFEDGIVDTALLDANGTELDAQRGAYAIRGEQLVLTGPLDVAWIFGRAQLVCDVGVKPFVRLGLFDCVGTGPLPDGSTPLAEFLPDLLFLAPPRAAT